MKKSQIIKNLNIAPLEVKHKELKRAEEDSQYKSICPNCERGLLLMQRDNVTFFLKKDDNCILCGRRYVYTDIVENQITLKYKEDAGEHK